MNLSSKSLLILMALLLLSSCGSEDGEFNTSQSSKSPAVINAAAAIKTMSIRPAFTKITGIGKTQPLTLDVLMQDGTIIEDVGSEIAVPNAENEGPVSVTWTTDNFGVAVVDENGVVTSVSSGNTVVKAQIGSQQATAQVIVESENSLNPNIDTALPPQ